MALWGAVMGHGNLIYHAAGWLEGGLVASFEKIVIDCEMLQPLKIDLAETGLEAYVAKRKESLGREEPMLEPSN